MRLGLALGQAARQTRSVVRRTKLIVSYLEQREALPEAGPDKNVVSPILFSRVGDT